MDQIKEITTMDSTKMEKPSNELYETAMGIAARVWCDQDMSHIEMDADAAQEIAQVLYRVIKERQKYPDFTKSLQSVLNLHNREKRSDTPDFILADFLERVLLAFDQATVARDHWYGMAPSPGKDPTLSYEAGPLRDTSLRIGAIIKLGKRLWRLVQFPKSFQGEDGWVFELTETSDGSCDQRRTFTRSELQWFVAHRALVGQPAEGPAVEL